MKRFYVLFALVLMLWPLPAAAQNADMAAFSYTLQSLNRTPISQSPRFKSEQDMLALRALDVNRQLVGQLEDVRVDDSGALTAIVSEINMAGRDTPLVRSAVNTIAYADDASAFIIPLADITGSGGANGNNEPVSAEDLAAIAPAAGGSGRDFSLRAMIGAEVRSDTGRWLGEVKHVMFDEQAAGITALVLQDVPGARRYTEIALPFDPAMVTVRDDFGAIEFRVHSDAAGILTRFARDNR